MFSHKSQKGFTLIEIVLVLVLLSILAVVALNKYYDLKSKAEDDAARAYAAQFAVEFNSHVAHAVMSGKSCEDAKFGTTENVPNGVINIIGPKYQSLNKDNGMYIDVTPVYKDGPTLDVYIKTDTNSNGLPTYGKVVTVPNGVVACDKYKGQ